MTNLSTPWTLSVSEACRLAGVSRSTIYALISSGRLPSAKIASRRVILREDLEAFVLSCKEARS